MKQKARLTDGSMIAYVKTGGGRLALPVQTCEIEDTGSGSVMLRGKDQDGKRIELDISRSDYDSYIGRKWLKIA